MPSLPIIFSEPPGSERSPYGFKNRVQNLLWHWCPKTFVVACIVSTNDLIAGNFMPPADIRQLRDLMCYRFKLTCFKSSEKNRLQNCLTVSNIQLGNVVSDTFGKSAQAIWISFWKIPQKLPLTLNFLFSKVRKRNSLNCVIPLTAILRIQQTSHLSVAALKIKYWNVKVMQLLT